MFLARETNVSAHSCDTTTIVDCKGAASSAAEGPKRHKARLCGVNVLMERRRAARTVFSADEPL